ncbi:MAG: phosphate/phosphite/phosphonate ABC transporter substrate-binding protein [Prochloraceae cyanobacterium]
MLPRFFRKVAWLGILIALASCNSQPTPKRSTSPQVTNPQVTKVIVLSDISSNPGKKIRRFQPLADYLAANLSQFEIGTGQVKVAPDLATMVQWLKEGKVDLYFDSPYPAMRAIDASGAQPILRRWKGGDADYYTVIFTLKSSGISSVSELKGKMMALDHRFSTSGYMLPVTYLLKAGLNLREKNSASATVAAEEVGYVFSDEDENSIEWVISKKVAAGAVDSKTFAGISEEVRSQTTILAQTEKVARNVVMVRSDMEPELLEAIKTLLIGMDKTAEGQEILKQFANTAKFDDFPPQESIQRMRELYEQVKSQEINQGN